MFEQFKKLPLVGKFLLIIAGILLLFPLSRYIINQLAKNKEAETKANQLIDFIGNQNPSVRDTTANSITTDNTLKAYANELAEKLGTKYSDNPTMTFMGINWSWLSPSGWTEDDKRCADIVIYKAKQYDKLKALYYQCYSNKRNLSDDLLNLLDADELKRVQKYVKLY